MVEIRQRARHIFQKDNCGFRLPDDPSDIGPEIAGVGVSLALPRVGEGLAREARSHAIHDTTPSSPIEGAEVAPDGSPVKEAVTHPGEEDGLAERVEFDETDGSRFRDRPLDPETEPLNARAEGKDIHRPHPSSTISQRICPQSRWAS